MSLPRCFRLSLPLVLILPGQICMAKILGSDLYPFVRHLHFDERALHSYVLHPSAGALQRERAPRVLRRAGIQIYTFKMKSIALIYVNYRLRHGRKAEGQFPLQCKMIDDVLRSQLRFTPPRRQFFCPCPFLPSPYRS